MPEKGSERYDKNKTIQIDNLPESLDMNALIGKGRKDATNKES